MYFANFILALKGRFFSVIKVKKRIYYILFSLKKRLKDYRYFRYNSDYGDYRDKRRYNNNCNFKRDNNGRNKRYLDYRNLGYYVNC